MHRFRREFRALARLDHPGVIRVHTWLEGPDGCGYLMDLIEGDTFFQAYRERFPAGVNCANTDGSLATALDWFGQAFEALGYIHRQGMVHRDVKPANFLIRSKGQVVLTDFGLVRPTDPLADSGALTQKGTVLGTCNYMAPEQARGLAVDHRADLYALFVMAYELLTGRHPFADKQGTAMMVAHASEPVVAPRAVQPAIPADLDAFLLHGLQKEPFRRPPFAHVAARTLRAILEQVSAGQGLRMDGKSAAMNSSLQPTTPMPGVDPGGERTSANGRGAFLMASPFIGRDRELALAAGWIEQLTLHGVRLPGFLAALVGESGIGKSRFLREVLALARLKGMAVIEEVSPEHSRPVLDTVSRVAARLIRPGDDLLSHAEIHQLGAWLPGLPLSDSSHDGLVTSTPELLRARGERVFLELLRRTASRQPLVIALDDAQWMDAESVTVWGRVYRELVAPREEAAGDRGDALALIVSLRAEDRGAEHLKPLQKLIAAGTVPQIQLGAFTAEETERFVQQMLGQSQPPQRLGARIHQETEGHPYFIEETLKALVETGHLVFDANAEEPWKPTPDEMSPVTSFALGALSNNIRPALQRRLDGSDTERKPPASRHAWESVSLRCPDHRCIRDEDLAVDAAELFLASLWREAILAETGTCFSRK